MPDDPSHSRGRSVPHAGPYWVVALLGLLNYFSLFGILTALFMAGKRIYFKNPDLTEPLKLLLYFILASVILWISCYIQRRSIRCPLCKGTPLLDSAASKHAKAWRLPPLSYGGSAVLSITFTQSFRCMYCGTPYDLTKTPSHKIH